MNEEFLQCKCGFNSVTIFPGGMVKCDECSCTALFRVENFSSNDLTEADIKRARDAWNGIQFSKW
jgi:hypothetical protein